MTCIVNLTISVKSELRAEFLSEFSSLLPVTRAYKGCHWLYLSENADSDTVEAVSKWDSREVYETYLGWREDSGDLGRLASKYFSADPVWKFMPVLMDFNN